MTSWRILSFNMTLFFLIRRLLQGRKRETQKSMCLSISICVCVLFAPNNMLRHSHRLAQQRRFILFQYLPVLILEYRFFFSEQPQTSPLLALISLPQLFVPSTSLSPVVLAPSFYLFLYSIMFFPLFLKQVWLEKHLQILCYKAFQSSSNQNAQYFSVFSELILVLKVFTEWGRGRGGNGTYVEPQNLRVERT